MSILTDKIFLAYWKLHCKLEEITICRSCGAVLDKDYKKRRRGKLCMTCNVRDTLTLPGAIDIDTVIYN